MDASLPYASTLCGACYEVCPVAIDIPEVLLHLRERVVQGGRVTVRGRRRTVRPARGHTSERAVLRAAQWVLERPRALRAAQRLASRTRGLHPRRLPGPGRAWTDSRELPQVPPEPFRDWWRRTRGEARESPDRGGEAGPLHGPHGTDGTRGGEGRQEEER